MKRFFTDTATISRNTVSTDEHGNKFTSLVEVGDITGKLRNLKPELAEQLRLNVTNSYTFWIDNTADVQRGDAVTIDSIDYKVHSMQKNDIGRNQHIKLILIK